MAFLGVVDPSTNSPPFVLLRFREVGRGVISDSKFAVPKLGAMVPTQPAAALPADSRLYFL